MLADPVLRLAALISSVHLHFVFASFELSKAMQRMLGVLLRLGSPSSFFPPAAASVASFKPSAAYAPAWLTGLTLQPRCTAWTSACGGRPLVDEVGGVSELAGMALCVLWFPQGLHAGARLSICPASQGLC